MKGRYLNWIVCILVLVLLPFLLKAQIEVKTVFSIDTASKFIETDMIKNLYIVTPANVILKYDSVGRLVTSQQFKNYGDIASLDVTNYLNPEIFYAGQNKVLIMDNTLNKVAEVNLEGSPIQQYTVGCRSLAGGRWFYDVQDGKLKRMDLDNTIQAESPNLATLGIKDLNPVYMLESTPWLYISIPSRGISLFDQYGAYYKNVPLKGLTRFTVHKNTIVYYKDGSLNYYDLETNEQKAVNLPPDTVEVRDVKVSGHRYWIQTKKGIRVYID
jgi:hypothetical protein